jgi:hypothetical protein
MPLNTNYRPKFPSDIMASTREKKVEKITGIFSREEAGK